ncbi:DNA-directed RNA polymerase-like protein I subunit [Phyllosticta capitalensis]
MPSSLGMNIAEPVSSSISGVEFGFLTSEEIRALSVKRITNSVTFDNLLHPTPGGLYDAALGAFLDNPCSTCNLNTHSCPGHCGHIELPVPVYHPTYMDQLLRLVRAQCLYCHGLKMPRVLIHEYTLRLKCLRYGLLAAEREIHEMKYESEKKDSKEEGEDVDSGDSDDEKSGIMQKREAFYKQALKSIGGKKRSEWSTEKTEAISEARRLLIKEFLYDINKNRKCANCGGISPSFRKDRYVKIFKKGLSVKDKSIMIQKGLKISNPLVEEAERQKRRQALKDKHKGDPMEMDEGVADMGATEIEDEEDGESIDVDEEITDGMVAAEAATGSSSKKAKDEGEGQSYVTTSEIKAYLDRLFEKEQEIFSLVYGPRTRAKKSGKMTADMFFIKTLVVPPTKYRPEAKTGQSDIAEAQQNSLYRNILTVCQDVGVIINEIKKGTSETGRAPRTYSDLQNNIVALQDAVNSLIDRDRNPIQGAAGKKNEDGIKQKLEKKEGLFRKNMMGKRVNFAARSVISPDPNIETNEIGVPPVFAMKLTYPEPVTSHNFHELKEAVLNGPFKWPGAAAIENEDGSVINLERKTYDERTALGNQLLAPSNTRVNGARNKKVYRHLNNGDVVIMNRQPTLHKPSMMCHRARVLPGEKTIRMHYANCNTYNADFDGDEMNMHFPQNELARAEAAMIADTDHQYLSSTAGAPLRGLIQDHISMGVSLTNKDTFFNREDYHQLLYACLRPEAEHTVECRRLRTVPPAILRPKPLWTGKQLITTVLKNIQPDAGTGLTLHSKSSTAADRWGKGSEEQNVLFKDGELLIGIMDKKQIGPSGGGLVNAVYEAYGHSAAGKLLSALGRMLTKLLHMRAFSCGVEDLVLTAEGEKRRRKILLGAEKVGLDVASKYVSLETSKPSSSNPELLKRMEAVLRDDSKQHGLDQLTNQATAALSSEVTKACLPDGLIKPFPKNQMQAMTGSGAKGSQVNANLISCNLGQQVLEGRRVPIMVSGKTLPCFKPFESSVRAGGYIVDRFLTGIRPQEYYFHTMAGREGLIDTAVKTSRSGYLQRCVIKGMEGLKVEYDTSVRDSDGSIVQFLYGEDGIDPTKEKYMNDFKFTAENFTSVVNNMKMAGNMGALMSPEASEWNKTATKLYKKTKNLAAMDPATSVFAPSRHAGATSEKFYQAKKKYIDNNPDKLITSKKQKVDTPNAIARKTFELALDGKYLKSIVEPGEAVGVVAGQSVGEPSTQMTLNTFHLAGHSAKNVTLGIPRLREIVMTASAKIGTPSMTLYLNPELSKEHGERFAKGISRLSLAEIIDEVTVNEMVGKGIGYQTAKIYKICLNLFPSEEYCKEYAIDVKDVEKTIERKFLPRLQKIIRAELKKKGEEKTLKAAAKTDALPDIGQSAGVIEQQQARPDEGGKRKDDDDDDDDDDDGDATNSKQRANRSENASYEKPDDAEEAIAKQARQRDATPEDDDALPNRSRSVSESGDDSESDSEDEGAKKKTSKAAAAERESRIKERVQDVASFKFDDEHAQWCEFVFEYDVSTAKLLMLHLVESACHDAVIQSCGQHINGCLATTEKVDGKDTNIILTEGVDLPAMWDYQDVIEPHKLFTNDIVAVLKHYGVEAARATIVREMNAVFGGHGISVDNRHLNLIADTMTRGGGYTAFNRMGMTSNPSPFMKMSFETTVGFLKDAVMQEDEDLLENPSARIVMGKLSKVGTGSFDVLMPVA